MLDTWVLLLAPVLLLPVVATLVFVGCSLDSSGLPSPGGLKYGAGFNANLVSLRVTFTLKTGEGTKEAKEKRQALDLIPNGGTIMPNWSFDTSDLDWDEVEWERCECTLIVPGNPDTVITIETEHSDASVTFELSRPDGPYSDKVVLT